MILEFQPINLKPLHRAKTIRRKIGRKADLKRNSEKIQEDLQNVGDTLYFTQTTNTGCF